MEKMRPEATRGCPSNYKPLTLYQVGKLRLAER